MARGFAADDVAVMTDKPTRETILAKLDEFKKLQPDDEFWLVLYGLSGITQGDEPAFQVSGPRLTAADLKKALDAIPAKQFVFIGTSESGRFLPALQNPRRTVVSATKKRGRARPAALSRGVGRGIRRGSQGFIRADRGTGVGTGGKGICGLRLRANGARAAGRPGHGHNPRAAVWREHGRSPGNSGERRAAGPFAHRFGNRG